MTSSATLQHNAGTALAGVDRNNLASKRLELEASGTRRARRGGAAMSAFGRGKWLSLRGAEIGVAVVTALAASLAWADGAPAAGPTPANHGGALPLLSPEAPPNFGDIEAGPLVSAFNAARAGGNVGSSLGSFAGLTFELVPAVEIAASDGAVQAKRAEARESHVAGAAAAAPAAAPSPPEASPPASSEPPAAPSLSPMQSALKAAMERLVAESDQPNPLGAGDWQAARAAIAAFYAARDYAPVWVGEDGLTEAGRAALAQLERARDDGLNLTDLALPREIGAGLAPDALAEAETAIASAVVAYAEQATGSRVSPSRVSPLIAAAPSLADPGAALAETAAAADPAERLADFNPPQKGYRDLKEEWKRLIEAAPSATRPAVELSAKPQPGGVLRLAKRPAAGRIHMASADAALAFGLLARRRAAILANMEMWRWEPRDMGERRIEVNVPGFSLAVMDGDTVVHEARVIVGKPDWPTPIFSSVMRYVLINPSWQVPDSIIKKELMPKLGSLSRRGYEVKTVGGRLTVRQLPGEDNALGRFAFMFPNDYAVYLHDTPARELFDEETRAFSHGCIRVEDPLSLAELVLNGEAGKWTAERIEAAIGGPERTVFLPRPLPIHIEYFTEFVDEFGELQERPDVYGLTRKVEGILARASQD
jgi:L,D-transpeptidase YcbB